MAVALDLVGERKDMDREEAEEAVRVLEEHLAVVPNEQKRRAEQSRVAEKAQAFFAELEVELRNRDNRVNGVHERLERLEERVTAFESGNCLWDTLAIIGIVVLTILLLLAGILLIAKAVR